MKSGRLPASLLQAVAAYEKERHMAAESQDRRRPKLPDCRLLLTILLFLALPTAQAIDEFPYDLRLLQVLNQIEMFDYGELQISLMVKKYPEKKDLIQIEKAKMLYAKGKRKDGDKIIAGIKSNSPYYAECQLLAAENAYKRRDMDSAAKAYAKYFAIKLKNPPKEDPEDVETFTRAVRVYARVLEQQGNAGEAQKVIGYLAKVTQGEGSERQLGFLKIQTLLSAEEEKAEQRKPVDTGAINNAIKVLKQMQWILDGVAAASYPETARAYILLEDYDKAMEALKVGSGFMGQVEEALQKDRNLAASPLAAALFYYGKAFKGKAFKAFKGGDRGEARKNLLEATKRFYKVVKDYGDCPYKTKAFAEFGKCKNLLAEKFDTHIKLDVDNVGEELKMKMEQAIAFLVDENWAGALAIYLDGVRVGRRSREMPELASRLVVCYAKLDRFLEAEAIVSYLAEAFPKNEGTADSLLKLGAFMYQKGKSAKPKDDRMISSAMAVWDHFVDVAPSHPKAPDIAFMIAENKYRIATEIGKQAADKQGKEKEDVKALAREAYMAAVPKYQRLVEQFSTRDKGIRALYKLGWIYYSTDQPKESADSFIRYCDSESDPKRNDDRLEAKFRAAEELMLSDAPADAVEHFTDLGKWLQPDSTKFDVATKVAKRVREDSASYLAWSFDLAGETGRPQLTELAGQIKDAKLVIRSAEKVLAAAEKQQAQAAKDIETAKAEFVEKERAGVKPAGEEEETPEQKAAAAEEVGDDATEEEKAAAERIAKERAGKLAKEKMRARKQRLEGERLGYEGEREGVKKEKNRCAAKLEGLGKKLAAAKTGVDELRKQKEETAAAHEKLAGQIRAARKAVADADNDVQKFHRGLEKAKELQQSDKASLRTKGALFRKKIATLLQAAQRKLDEAHAKREKVVTPEAEQKEKELAAQVEELAGQLKEEELAFRRLEQQKALAEKDAELLQARLVAVAKALDRNNADEKEAPPEELKKLSEEFVQNFRVVMEKKIEKAVQIQTMAREEMALARQRIAEAQERIKAIEVGKKPVQAVFDEWKRKAQVQFQAFLKQFPKSKHVPDNMARLGTIHLEFGEFGHAAKILSELSSKFPDSNAGKQALFNLGRAQCEIEKFEEAAGSFIKLLKDAEELTSPNLSYVSEKMLDAGYPKPSLGASKELLRRSEDEKHPDYDLIRERAREPALFRAGVAAYQIEDYDNCLVFFQKLLEEKENTAYYFLAKFRMGMARRKTTPADYEGAIGDFSEVSLYATDPVMRNEAVCRIGETYMMQGGKDTVMLGVARFQQIVMLADASIPENQPWIEMAIYESAKGFARLGDAQNKDKMVAKYRDLYPSGKYRQDIANLPAAEFAAAPAPAPGGQKK